MDVPSSPADSLDVGLAAGFAAPRSSLGDMRPPLLKEAEGESAHIVQPNSDAMPPPESGDRQPFTVTDAASGDRQPSSSRTPMPCHRGA